MVDLIQKDINPFCFYCRNDICNNSKLGNVTLCPNCEKDCDFDTLNSSCLLARVTYTVDNTMTVVFAIFMSLWGKLEYSTQCIISQQNVSFESKNELIA